MASTSTPRTPSTPSTPSSPGGTLTRDNSKKDAGVFGWMGTLSRRKKGETEGKNSSFSLQVPLTCPQNEQLISLLKQLFIFLWLQKLLIVFKTSLLL